ncbi:hypothetical protein [Halorussus pelagicus]|uniref:hypothetical protein n=1 Tax=Halorussus pelagicus TaxID=2505977 RepID=UPI000FFBCECF|nr:hypothetical protein [Halorussus pelagicus]
MSEENRTPTRRTVLKNSALSMATFGSLTGVSAAQTQSKEVVDKVSIKIPDNSGDKSLSSSNIESLSKSHSGVKKFDTGISGLHKLDSIVVEKYNTGEMSYSVSGTNQVSKTGVTRFQVRSGIGPNGDGPLAIEVVPSQKQKVSKDGNEGCSSGTDGTLSSMDSDSGSDLTEDYEGGVHTRTGTNEDLYLSDQAHHRQVYDWSASGGNVGNWDGDYCTNWKAYDVSGWTLEGNGWKNRDSSGDNYYSESYAQLTTYNDSTTNRTQHEISMTMKPDGTFDWTAEITNTASEWATEFEMYSTRQSLPC